MSEEQDPNWIAYQKDLRDPKMQHFEGKYVAYHNGAIIMTRLSEGEVVAQLEDFARQGRGRREVDVLIREFSLCDLQDQL